MATSKTAVNFSDFSTEQAAQYASGRGYSYPHELYNAIFDYHTGKRHLLLDVGTGPGKVVFDLLPHFNNAIGCDLGPGMIEQAKIDSEKRGAANKTHFVVCPGEECDKALEGSQFAHADMITIATAAHWLDISGFYQAAARALRPGGTLAIWMASSLHIHPSEPNAGAIQDALEDMNERMLLPYRSKGSVHAGQTYENLGLPWTTDEVEPAFEEANFVRKEWNKGGVPSAPPKADGTAGELLVYRELKFEDLEKAMRSSTGAMRWREEHPDKAYSDEDPVILTIQRIKELSGGKEGLTLSPSPSLLLFRRK